jgi:hypothetical protein
MMAYISQEQRPRSSVHMYSADASVKSSDHTKHNNSTTDKPSDFVLAKSI